MDLSGFSEFRYGVEIVENGSVKEGMERLSDNDKGRCNLYLRLMWI